MSGERESDDHLRDNPSGVWDVSLSADDRNGSRGQRGTSNNARN